jgi:hypothetical protein
MATHSGLTKAAWIEKDRLESPSKMLVFAALHGVGTWHFCHVAYASPFAGLWIDSGHLIVRAELATPIERSLELSPAR